MSAAADRRWSVIDTAQISMKSSSLLEAIAGGRPDPAHLLRQQSLAVVADVDPALGTRPAMTPMMSASRAATARVRPGRATSERGSCFCPKGTCPATPRSFLSAWGGARPKAD
jgi:hypothetical protein